MAQIISRRLLVLGGLLALGVSSVEAKGRRGGGGRGGSRGGRGGGSGGDCGSRGGPGGPRDKNGKCPGWRSSCSEQLTEASLL